MTIKTTSIIGLSKNAGKTTLLNYLLTKLNHKSVGIASIGVDGEAFDVWSSMPKPAITVPKGCFVATTNQGLKNSTGEWRVIAKLDLHSITGTVYIAEALTEATVKLLGTHTLDDIIEVKRLYEKLGIDEFIIDGAYDRLASANPILAEQTYLVIGASLQDDDRIFWNQVYEKIYPFFFPKLENEQVLKGISDYKGNEENLVFKQNKWFSITIEELINDKAFVAEQTDWLYLSGILLDNTLVKLLNKKHIFNIVLKDGLKNFASLKTIERWQKAGGTIRVINPINVQGIAINPYSPSGYSFSTSSMKNELKNILTKLNRLDIPVINIWED